MSPGIFDKIRKRNIPLSALFELTQKCNLSCCHCYLPADISPNELPAGQIKNALDQLSDAKTIFITFSGGEVFLRDDFFEIVTYAKKNNFIVSILTNGTLIDEKIADRLENLNPIKIEISIYGANCDLHDGITGVPGSFDRSMNAIRLLKDRDTEVKIKTSLMKQNIDQYKEIILLAEKLKVKYEFNPGISPGLDGSRKPLAYRINEQELLRILSDPSLNPKTTKINDSKLSQWDKKEIFMCGAGRTSCVISTNGDLHPCLVLRMPFGNIRKQLFSEIWDSSDAKKFRAVNFCDLKTCVKCDLAPFCERCQGIALLEDGDIAGPARFFCKIADVRRSINEGVLS